MKPWEFYSTTDKILRVLIENDGNPPGKMMEAVRLAFPSLSQNAIDSAISHLSQEHLISVLFADDEIFSLRVHPRAAAYLMDQRDRKIFSLKWDFLKIAFGYVLGFLSSAFLHLLLE